MQKIKNTLFYLIYVVVVVTILSEIVLKIYNPFKFRVRGYDIVLPIKEKYTIKNTGNNQLERTIIHTKNSLGFRGSEKPSDYNERLSIITVGGSTTECYYVSDSLTWAVQLENKIKTVNAKVWINNAGLNGQSSFGHQILVDKYLSKLNPKYAIFLVGINDMDRNDLNQFDATIATNTNYDFKDWLIKNSELVNIFVNLKRYFKAKSTLGLSHDIEVLSLKQSPKLSLNQEQIEETLVSQRKNFIPNYLKRIDKLMNECRKNHIVPILVTQPLLFGYGTDSLTKVDLATIKTGDNQNGELYWKKIEVYNDALRTYATSKNIALVDLAREMPKNSLYFYDAMHFTKEGCKQVAQILFLHLSELFSSKSPTLEKKSLQ
jgi:lysophospholipase L1-like esterase